MNAVLVIGTLTSMYPNSNWQDVIFTYYCGEWSSHSNFISPIRNDSAPSARIFVNEQGNYLYHDYGTNVTMGIWKFVWNYHVAKGSCGYEFSVGTAAGLVNKDMELGLDGDDIFAIPSMPISMGNTSRNIKASVGRDFEIGVYPLDWTYDDMQYWNRYGISLDCCNFFNVGAAAKSQFKYPGEDWYDFHIYRRTDPMYYYLFHNKVGEQKFKILRPHAKDSQKKWRTNIDKHDMALVQGMEQLPETFDYLFLTSSLKDVMALRMIGIPAIALHGEGYNIPIEFIEALRLRFPKLFWLYDNDYEGMKACDRHDEYCKLDGKLYIPNGHFINDSEVKDPSDYNAYHGGDNAPLQKLILNFLNQNNIHYGLFK